MALIGNPVLADIVDKATRSRMMAGIRGRDTKPELRIRSALHRAGFRYRLHEAKLPGRPDLVLPKFHAVVFAQGCFWHRHEGCSATTTPGSNAEYWQERFCQNVERDTRNIKALRAAGWRVAVVWECAVKRMTDEEIAKALGSWLHGVTATLDIPDARPNGHASCVKHSSNTDESEHPTLPAPPPPPRSRRV